MSHAPPAARTRATHPLAAADRDELGQDPRGICRALSPDDGSAPAPDAVDRAVRWLRRHGTLFNAGLVYAPLLDRPQLGPDADEIVARAVAWVPLYPAKLRVNPVATTLLRAARTQEARTVAIHHAWTLQRTAREQMLRHVLKDTGLRGGVTGNAALFMASLKSPQEGLTLLTAVQPGCSPTDEQLRTALQWVRARPTADGYRGMLELLLRRPELYGPMAREAAELALTAMRTRRMSEGHASLVLQLLHRPEWVTMVERAALVIEAHALATTREPRPSRGTPEEPPEEADTTA